MSNQVGLLPPQSKLEALQDLSRVPAIGGWKELAVRLRPELAHDPEAAGKWLDRALQDNRREAFKDEHFRDALRIGASVGYHGLWYWHARDVGYHPSDPLQAPSRRRLLLEEKARLAVRACELEAELEALDEESGADVRVVK